MPVKGYISVKYIIEKVYRDSGREEELNWPDAVEWAGEALDFIGASPGYQSKYNVTLTIADHKAALPCDYNHMIQVKYNNQPLVYASGSFGNVESNVSTERTDTISGTSIDEDNFFLIKDTALSKCNVETYTINDYFIMTSIDAGDIVISYKATPVDDEGFPTIPDDVYYKQAMSSYIQYKLDHIDWRRGKVAAAVYNESKEAWEFYVRAAAARAFFPSLDQMESFKRQWVRLIPVIDRHDESFSLLNEQEQLKRK